MRSWFVEFNDILALFILQFDNVPSINCYPFRLMIPKKFFILESSRRNNINMKVWNICDIGECEVCPFMVLCYYLYYDLASALNFNLSVPSQNRLVAAWLEF